MQLLKPQQGKSRADIEIASQEVRISELEKQIVAKRKELNDLDNRFLRETSELGLKNSFEEQYWKDKIQALTIEIDALESRKKSALLPLVEREKKLEDGEGALLKREEAVAIKESDLDAKSILLEDRLDDISEREQEATAYSVTLNSREFAIGLQEQQVKSRMEALTEILRQSFEDITRAKAEAAERKAILKGRDVSISEREKYVESQIASFDNREKALLDRYRTLQKAITETNVPTGLHSTKRSEP